MTACVLCTEPCVPMADWEPVAVCLKCDAQHEAAVTKLLMYPPKAGCGTPTAYQRHLRRREPTDKACRAAWAAHVRAQRLRRRSA